MLCSLGKVLEKIINSRLLEHTEATDVLPNEQHGFRRGYSTIHQLVRVTNYIENGLRHRKSIGVLALDIEKAFDSVWYDGLIFKLIQGNFPRYLIQITNSFLRNRDFKVKMGNSLSEPQLFQFGVPQGSVLSPLLYNIYTADVPKCTKCELALFADDTAIYTESRFQKTIQSRLTAYYKKLNRFFVKWKIAPNAGKTQAIFCTKRRKLQLPAGPLELDQNNIVWSDSIKYLGLHIDKRLTYASHIDETLVKMDKIIRILYPLIHRHSELSLNIKLQLYKTCIRPSMLYAAPILAKASKTQLKRLQVKQNKILKVILNKDYKYNTIRLHQESGISKICDYIFK